MNKVILMGRLTADPELKITQSNIPVASFTIAVNRKDSADFINCVAWRGTAELICKHFNKGKMIAIVGSLQSRTWQDNDGKNRKAVEVVVSEVHFCGDWKKQGDSAQPDMEFEDLDDVEDDELPF